MADFSFLSEMDATEKTADFAISEIEVNGVSPTLTLKSMTQSNTGYFNAVMKQTAKKAGSAKKKLTADTLDEARDADRKLFVAHVLAGWKDMFDGKGKKVPYNKQNAEQFIKALPDWLFDRIRVFCNEITNFVDDATISTEEVEETAKN